MASKLPKIGVRAVVEGVGGFIRDIGLVNAGIKFTESKLKGLTGGQESNLISITGVTRAYKALGGTLTSGVARLTSSTAATEKLSSANKRLSGSVKGVQKSMPALTSGISKATTPLGKFEKAAANIKTVAPEMGESLGRLAPLFGGLAENIFQNVPALKAFAPALGGVTEILAENIKSIGPSLKALAKFAAPVVAPLAAVAVGVGAVIATIALGVRGAAFEGIIDAFDSLAMAAGRTGDALINELQVAAAGMIPDLELMKKTNLALAGSTGKLRDEFIGALPKLLEIARAQAAATGQAVDSLFGSLVTGIKRSSPMLIDNTGLVISIGEANEKYAEAIGVTVTELTKQEQQLALLNATIEAGNVSLEQMGGLTLTAADKMAQLSTIVTNSLDMIALGVQPLFNLFLDIGLVLVTPLEGLANVLGGLFAIIGELANLLFGPFVAALQFVSSTLNDALNVLGDFLFFVADAISFINDVLTSAAVSVGNTISNFLNQVVNALTTGFQFFLTDILGISRATVQQINDLMDVVKAQLNPQAMMVNGARVMGALAAGIILGGVQVLRAVRAIAKGIADFLVGSSPPPLGPLSTIDQAGQDLINTYMDGMAGVSLEPIHLVAKDVQAALGDIATLTLPQVEAQLHKLDLAIAPFTAQLKIVKAQFEAISAPAEAALRAIDRQMEIALQALANGEAGSAEMVRNLDIQRQAIKDALQTQQNLVDSAQIQLAMTKAQQAEERALLEIRELQLKGVKATTKATQTLAKTTKKAVPKLVGGVEPGGVGGVGLPRIDEAGDVGDVGGGDDLNLLANFLAPIAGTDAIGQLNDEIAGIGEEVDRINPEAVADNFGSMFAGIGEVLEDTFVTPFNDAVKVVVDFFTDASIEGTLAHAVSNLGPNFSMWLGDIGGIITDKLSGIDGIISLNLVLPMQTAIQEIVGFFNDETQEGSLAKTMSELDDNVTGWFLDVGTSLTTSLAGINSTVTDNFVTPFQDAVKTVGGFFTDEAQEGSFAKAMSELDDNVTGWFLDLGTVLSTEAKGVTEKFDTVISFFTDSESEGTLAHSIANLPSSITGWLTGIGTTIDTALIVPFKEKITEAVNSITSIADPFSLASAFSNIALLIGGWLSTLPAMITTWLISPIVGPVGTLIGMLVDPEVAGSLAAAFFNLGANIGIWLAGLKTTLTSSFVQPLDDAVDSVLNFFVGQEDSIFSVLTTFFTGTGEGTFIWLLAQATTALFDWVNTKIPDVLNLFGGFIWSAIAVPMIKTLNFVIRAINSFLQGIVDSGLLAVIAAIIPGFDAPDSISIPTISLDPPPGLLGAQTGGLFSGGLLNVGERGPEVVGSASKMAVFPNAFVTAIDRLSDVLVNTMASQAMVSAGSGGSVVNDSSSSNQNNVFNFPQQGDSSDAVRRLTMMGIFN